MRSRNLIGACMVEVSLDRIVCWILSIFILAALFWAQYISWLRISDNFAKFLLLNDQGIKPAARSESAVRQVKSTEWFPNVPGEFIMTSNLVGLVAV